MVATPTSEAKKLAAERIEERKQQFARNELSLEDLEDAIRFWLKVEDCPYCGCDGSMCSGHYDYWYSYGEQ